MVRMLRIFKSSLLYPVTAICSEKFNVCIKLWKWCIFVAGNINLLSYFRCFLTGN
jgi:hypothetical protein